MTSIDVSRLRELLARRAGLDLGRGGMEVNLTNFVGQRLAASGLTFQRYVEQLDVPGSEELRLLLEAMTVVYTWFFRDPGQFSVLERLVDRFPSERTMGIWVAGCATGEEPFSVALVAAGLGRRVDILGTDLNSEALRHAERGCYASASLSPVDPSMRARYLGNSVGDYVVPDTVRQSVRFRLSNLVEAVPRAPSAEGWDLVLCRNVLIYFGQEQARRTLNNLASCLAPGGHLILGASEAILERPTSLTVVGIGGRAVLQRPLTVDGCQSEPRLGASRPLPKKPADRVGVETSCAGPSSFAGFGTVTIPGSQALAESLGQQSYTESRNAVQVDANNTSKPTADGMTTQIALAQGHEALNAGNIPLARECYARAVRLDATCAEASMFAGIAHYLDGETSEALHFLRGALCLDSTLWAACFYQALCYENMGYADDAAHSYSLVLKLANALPSDAEGHPFLKAWRNDLLVVASKRAHGGRHQHTSTGGRPGSHSAGSVLAAAPLDRGAWRRSTPR